MPTNRCPRYVHIDLGLTRDACGMAMAYCEEAADGSGSPVAVVELMHRLVAPAGGEVDLSRPREIVLALKHRGFPVAQVTLSDGRETMAHCSGIDIAPRQSRDSAPVCPHKTCRPTASRSVPPLACR